MNSHLPSDSPPRPGGWKAILLLVLVFVIGVATGVGGAALVVRRSIQKQISTGNFGTPLVDRVENDLIARLKLTPEEQAAVAPEFDITRREIRMQRLRMLQALRGTGEDTLQRVKAKLPPEKQAELEKAARNRFGSWGLLRRHADPGQSGPGSEF